MTKVQSHKTCGHCTFVAKVLSFSQVLMALYFSLQSDCSAAAKHHRLKNKHPSEASAVRVLQIMIRVFKLVTLQLLSYTVQVYSLFVFVHTKRQICIFIASPLTRFFNNSVIAICKLFHGTRSSQQEEQFERRSCYRHFKMNNNFGARTICRGVKIFSIARKQSLPLPGLLCTEICS